MVGPIPQGDHKNDKIILPKTTPQLTVSNDGRLHSVMVTNKIMMHYNIDPRRNKMYEGRSNSLQTDTVKHKMCTSYFVTSRQFAATEMHLVRCFYKARIPFQKNFRSCSFSCSFSKAFAMQIMLPTQNCPFACSGSERHLIYGSFGPQPKWHLDQFSCFCRAQHYDRLTDRPRYSICNNMPHLYSSEMRPNNKLCNIVVTDGTNQ